VFVTGKFIYLSGINLIQMCLCWNHRCLASLLKKLFEESLTFARVQLSYIAGEQFSQQKQLLYSSLLLLKSKCESAHRHKCFVLGGLIQVARGLTTITTHRSWNWPTTLDSITGDFKTVCNYRKCAFIVLMGLRIGAVLKRETVTSKCLCH